MKGVTTFTSKLAVVSAAVGGSALTYLAVAVELSLPWALMIALAVLFITFAIGAMQSWAAAVQTARAYMPTWEHCQAQADTLKALTYEFREDGSGGLVEVDQLDQQKLINFRREYMLAHMAFVTADFDRACAAGYKPNFDRDTIGTANLPDVVEFAAEFERVAQRWRESEAIQKHA